MRWFAARCASLIRKVPVSPRTTFNLGQLEGGTSVNSIPYEAKLKVDLRSESEDEIIRLESAFRECMAAGVRDEMDNARDRSKGKLEWKVNLIGSRPGGDLPADSALLAALRAADDSDRKPVAHRAFLHGCEHSALDGNRSNFYRRRGKWRGSAFTARVVRARGARKRIEASSPDAARSRRCGFGAGAIAMASAPVRVGLLLAFINSHSPSATMHSRRKNIP